MNVEELLLLGRYSEIPPSKALAYLYHPDELLRFRAAEALGELCRGEKARNYILRLFWHLSDESGAYCIGAPLGIAEIGRRNPEIFGGFRNKYVSLLDDWEVERKYVAYGIGRVAEIVKNAYPDPVEKLKEKIDEIRTPDFVVYALWALKRLECDIVRYLQKFGDFEAEFYDGRRIRKEKISELFTLL